MKDKTDACTNNPGGTILAYYKPKPSEMSLLEMKSLYVTAAASWAVTHGIPWTMFSSPTFRNLFLPLNSKALQIVNVDGPKIRQQVMKLGKYAEEAIECELKGKRLAWTSDHWTGPNDETYTTVTAHYMSDNWEMKKLFLYRLGRAIGWEEDYSDCWLFSIVVIVPYLIFCLSLFSKQFSVFQ